MIRKFSFWRLTILFSFLFCTWILAAQELFFNKAPWTLKVDGQSGALLQLKWNEHIVSNNPSGAPLFNWGPKWIAGSSSAPVKLISHNWDEESGTLRLNTRIGEYEIAEIFSLGVNEDPDLFSVGVEFTWNPANQESKFVSFNHVSCNFPILGKGRYFLPGKANFLDPVREGKLSDLPKGTSYRSAWGVPPILIETDPELTLIFMPEYRNDIADNSIHVSENGAVSVHVESRAAGWAFAGQPQHLGPFYLGVYPGQMQKAFETRIHQMYDSIGLKAVKDTPDWFRDAVIYSFCAGGTIGSGSKDLGGFTPAKEEFLPRLKQLGFTTIWLLPVEDGNNGRPYWPRDYYKVNSNFGTSEELKALVDAAHNTGLRILFDSVPHGGTPQNAMLRGNKPWHLAYNLDGTPNNYWCLDFGDPEWQKYIADVAAYHMKKYGIDGYRIDAVIGNNYLNWRRADFPAVCPPNVDPVWWKKSLEENGGKMPDLQYERASLGCRQGGLQMLKGIRNAVKSNKVDGVILAEVDHAPYMQDADAIFNFPMASTIQKSSTRMPADRWTKILARWLDEGNFVYPKGSRWMQYFGSHDHQNPYHYLGVGAIRTLIGYAMMLDGIPMVYQDQDIGIGVFLKRMIAIRKALPELRRGTGRYASPAPMTLSAFRAYGNNYSVGLANIGPDSVQVRLADAIPEKLSEEGGFVLYSSEKSAPLADGNLTELAAKSVTVPPFSCQVLAFRPSGSTSPFSENASKTVYPGMKRQEFSFLEKEDEYIVKSPVYQLTLSRKTGMITGFSDISGKRLFTGSGFITDPSPELQKDIAVENMEVDVIQGKMFVKITAQGNLNNSSPVTLRYLCHPEKVTVEGILEQPQGLPRAGLVFTGNSIDRWQVSSAEGLLDDYFSTRHMKGKPSREKDEGLFYYRMSGTPVMWQSALNPLSFEHPAIAAFSDGKGFEMKFRDLLSCPPDNIALLDKLSRRPGWAVAVYWKDQGPYPFTRKIPETSRFSFDIKPIDEPLEAPATTQWTAVGNVKFRNVSRGWEVDNGIYRLLIQRTGGCIQELQTRSGKVLIDQSHIFTNRGFRRRHSGKNVYATSSNDGETSVAICEKDGKLRMRFDFTMRDGYLIEPEIWGMTEYEFDETPDIGIRWSVLSEGEPKDSPVFLAWGLISKHWNITRFWKDGVDLGTQAHLDNRSFKDKSLPDRVDFYGKDGRSLFELNHISYPENSSTASTAKTGEKFNIATFRGPAAAVQPGCEYEHSLTLTVKE